MSGSVLFTLSAIASLTGCLVLERHSHRLGLMDAPGERKLQKTPVPRAGGLAIFLIYCVSMGVMRNSLLLSLTGLGALAIYLGGLYDDRKPTNRVSIKLAFQTAGALLAAVDLYSHHSIGALLSVVCFGFILVMTNSFNLMDNMNGLTAGMSSVLVLALFWLGLVPASSALVLTGALIGFLVLNYPWGRIFLGDQGSQFLGFWLSALALHGLVAKYDVSPDLSTALYCISFLGIAFLPFIFDTILVIVIRLRAGRPITVGDRNHLSHQLLRSGVSVNLVPVTLVSVQALCGFICYWLAKYWLGSV